MFYGVRKVREKQKHERIISPLSDAYASSWEGMRMAALTEKEEPLCDVFATQGILAVLTCIGVFALHLFAPAFCRDLLFEWHRIAAESPSLTEIAAAVSEWFVSFFSG